MKIPAILCLLLMASLARPAAADNDCTLGKGYVSSAREHAAAAEPDEAQKLLAQSIEACPSYDAYQLLGDLQAQSAQREQQAQAVDAYVAAAGLAPSPKARAHTLFSYAQLLERDGDPQNAYPLIRDAQTLDPADAQIAQLSGRIEQQVNNPTGQNLTRGLWGSMYKPLKITASVRPPASADDAGFTAGSAGSAGSGRGGSAASGSSAGPSINIPIHFETGSVVVDATTRANVAILAGALADPEHASQHYLFVGHADIRGNEAANVALSKQRAAALYQAVVAVTPSLRGRVDVDGKGSAEPIDPARNERAYRANRRLQVLLH
jgi:outer membrane protein OmpA-like peptidoglycan-associated protein